MEQVGAESYLSSNNFPMVATQLRLAVERMIRGPEKAGIAFEHVAMVSRFLGEPHPLPETGERWLVYVAEGFERPAARMWEGREIDPAIALPELETLRREFYAECHGLAPTPLPRPWPFPGLTLPRR